MIGLALAFWGLVVLARLVWASRSHLTEWLAPLPNTKVSVIIPCRNEEKNLPRLLESLKNQELLEGLALEIIVVDDDSTDATFEIASRSGVRVLRAPAKPTGWVGKTWACSTGAREATGDYLLFTDADTWHSPDAVARAASFVKTNFVEMMSAPPFHECKSAWEKALGPFLMLPLITTDYAGRPRPGRVFAIGQYLMFSRETYFALGGHEAVRTSLAEDIDLATRCLEQKRDYRVYLGDPLYQVQMYDSARTFWDGWKRLLRIGFKRSSGSAMLAVFGLLELFVFGPWAQTQIAVAAVIGVVLLAMAQRRHGRFAFWGSALVSLNLLLFLALNLNIVWDLAFKKGIQWHGRSYADG